MKVHVFESEPWVKAAWTVVGTHPECVWIQGLLTPEKAGDHVDAEIISSDVSVLDATALAPFKQLRFIALRSTGTDQVDLEYCRSRNIAVSNVPAYARNAVAEHVFALLLALGRHLLSVERFKLMKKGVVIINTARGDVVDSQALLEALASGKVAGAGLGVA